MGAGLRQLCLEAGQEPVPAIYCHQIELEYVRIDVESLRQGMLRGWRSSNSDRSFARFGIAAPRSLD